MAYGEITLQEGLRASGREAFFAALQSEAALTRDPSGFWVASRFEDIRAILLDHARFSSSAMGGGGAMGGGLPLLTDDPPRHTVLRGLLAKAFTPAAMEAMRPDIARLARQLAADLPRGAAIDIVARFTAPLPIAVIAGMMGVPAERAADFRRWSNAVMGLQDSPLESDRMATVMELGAYFAQLAAERRASPGDDLVTALTRASEARETLSDRQIVGFCVLLMVAGNETTANLLANLLARLARAPAAWAALRADPALAEAAIEESLRLDSPVQIVMRAAREEVMIGGQRIAAGERVIVCLAAAHRDPARWPNPAAFSPERPRERHLAFGHGVHACIGAPLARIEARAAMMALIERFATLAPAAAPGVRIEGGLLFGFRSLPLVFG